MSTCTIIQICADRGIAPGSTKGAALHLRGVARGLRAAGANVITYSERPGEGPFPVELRRLHDLTSDAAVAADVIYERYSLGHRAGLDLARRSGACFVLEVNAPLVDEARTHRPGTVKACDGAIELELLYEADLVISVSSELTEWIGQRRDGPVRTIANGFEPAWFCSTSEVVDGPGLVFLGHPKPWHGALRLPRILAGLAARGLRPGLRIIGGGPGIEEILQEAIANGVDDQIEVTGALRPDEAAARLMEADIGLAPYTRIDPFYFCPLKIVDYLAAGLPIVGSALGDIPALVGDAGIVVDPDDDLPFIEAVAGLLHDPEARRGYGNRGLRRASAEMTWDSVAARTMQAIDGVRDRAAIRT